MRICIFSICIYLIVFTILNSCVESPDIEIEKEERIVNRWINGIMHEVYFWNDQIDYNFNPLEKQESETYFYELVYDEEDIWSWITDDYSSLSQELEGTIFSPGFSPAFGVLEGTEQVFIIVQFVYPGSSADLGGLKRGDIILTIDGEELNIDNYYDLYTKNTYSVGLGAYNGNFVYESGITLSLPEAPAIANPVIHSEILNYSNNKIGYLVYVSFINGIDNLFLDALGDSLEKFRNQGITDLIIDLRYNSGGEMEAARFFASALVPADVMNNTEILVSLMYNELYQEYFESNDWENDENLFLRFKENEHNLNLSRIYFLTGNSTASASELLISGLDPYMEVVKIGEQTSGKYTGAWVIPDVNDPPEHDWAMIPIVLKYANADGFTDFVNGLLPDFVIEDDLFNAVPFGDTTDPMLAQALELITGEEFMPLMKSTENQKFIRITNEKISFRKNLILKFPEHLKSINY